MQRWLKENRRQYETFLRVVNFLLREGFDPVPTDPLRNEEYRTDHTRAMVDLLGSFPQLQTSPPLKLFATGPLFHTRRSVWAQAVDVEILGSEGEIDNRQLLGILKDLVAQLAPDLSDQEYTMVYGQVDWLKRYLVAMGCAPEDYQELYRWLQQGNLQAVEAKILEYPGGNVGLLRPQPSEKFFPALNASVPITDPEGIPENWTTLWDLSLVGNWSYYSGLVFTLYHNRTGQVLANGGRFGIKTPTKTFAGAGFTIYFDVWQEALAGPDGYVHVS